MALVELLDPKSTVALYSISKPFHYLFNSHYTTYVLAAVRKQAPHAEQYLPIIAFRSMAIRDPAGRPTANDPLQSRLIPSLRWLQMAVSVHNSASSVLWSLWASGHKTPPGTLPMLYKLALTMAIGNNHNRIGLAHNPRYWTDADLRCAICFMVKLDMRFNDPVEGRGVMGLRGLLLGQRSLAALRDALADDLDTMALLQLQGRYDLDTVGVAAHAQLDLYEDVFGVQAENVGTGCLEGFGRTLATGPMKIVELARRERLLRPDQLLMQESCRRGLRIEDNLLDYVMYGYWLQWSKNWKSYSKPFDEDPGAESRPKVDNGGG